MADENTVRSYRSSGGSAPGAAAKSGDPLADLARLIGQSDPFAEFGQKTARSSERVATAGASAASDWRRTAAAMPPYQTEKQPRSAPDARVAAGYARPDAYQRPDYEMPLDEELMADPRSLPQAPMLPEMPAQGRYAQERVDDLRSDPLYAAASDSREGEPYFDDGAPLTPQDEQSYDDVPRARRRSGLFTAVTLIACAMVGTAGAYGYRTYYTGPISTKVPPVIPAEVTPNKIVPTSDGTSSKTIKDRVGEVSTPERMMPPSEQPVDLKTSGASNPRVVLPPPVAPLTNQTSPPSSGVGSLAPQGAPAGPGGEPKRVRTVTIRPEGSDGGSRTVGSQSGGGAGRTAAPSRTVPPTVRGNGGPISLDPQAPTYSAPPTPPAPLRERSAAAMPLTPPAPRASAGPPLAATQPSTGAGGYLVQLSSQKSEAEAHASFRTMQGRYPSQLGGRSALVKRADLGAKGTFYRAMVGPFASSGEADHFCSNLKAAGGQCIIQRN